MNRILPVIIAACSLSACSRNTVRFDPPAGARIVIMGNTFADRMQHHGYFEALLHDHFPDRRLVVRNLGWSADEPYLQPRPLNFGSVHDHLTAQQADIIFLCFGMNESFKGADSVNVFSSSLRRYCRELLSYQYNGRSSPALILVSPIAHEDVGGLYPNPGQHNRNLELYKQAMQRVAEELHLGFIDLYRPSQKKMREKNGLITTNGIHLNDQGYAHAANWMAEALNITKYQPESAPLKRLAEMKNQHFFYRWRAVNGEYIYGRRQKPFGVVSYPPEMQALDRMVASLDSLTWKAAAERSQAVQFEAAAKQLVNLRKPVAEELVSRELYPASTAQFTLPPGYAVNLFASEKDFPVQKPVAMNFDAKGRLWVATMPTYPQYFPGYPPLDKIVILEDTDRDGRADKHTVFADSLYLPLGFLFGKNGVYVAEEPNLLFLQDTDGDDRADKKEIVLQGFGSEDSHHATHAFTWGQDGAMYFHEGTFHHSQVETPYGPVRAANGATFRYEPRTGRLSRYIAYPYNNPWGNVFDKWGMHLIGDASDGMNYYATPLTVNTEYPEQHPRMEMFTATKVRPTAGIEIVSSRHFPDNVQGNFLVNNIIGFQGIKQHRLKYEGSGVSGEEVENLLQSSDPNFRPVDLKFGPDGALYVADWFNPLIGHMQHSLRDPGRDKSHGRIWRITYPARPLSVPEDLSVLSVPRLLDKLKAPEDRLRFRAREALRVQNPGAVIPALAKWVSALDTNDSGYAHQLLEALWIHQDFQQVNKELLGRLLESRDHRARAAAARVLLYWKDSIAGSATLMRRLANDASPRVRIEAAAALSYFQNDTAAAAALDLLRHPMDYYLGYTTRATLRYLKPVWERDANAKLQAAPWLDSLAQIEQEADRKAANKPAGTKPMVEVSTIPSRMLFDKGEIVLPARTRVVIRFSNPDEMPHNLVIISDGSLQKVGKAADAMAATKDGFEKHFVPRLPEVLFATPLVEAGKSYDLEFMAPAAGEYLFICSFPGHWNMMKGVIRFESR